MCQVHPLSTTKLIQRSPFRRCLLRRSGLRRAQLAIMTRAFVASGADMLENVGVTAGFGQDEANASAASGCGAHESKWHSCPASTLGAENVAP
eukprot:6114898-Pleurochrysis_carterae.AAC.1